MVIDSKYIVLNLTPEDAQLFIEYRKNQDNFIILQRAGIFSLSSGKVEININNGKIQNIYIRERVFEHLTEKKQIL